MLSTRIGERYVKCSPSPTGLGNPLCIPTYPPARVACPPARRFSQIYWSTVIGALILLSSYFNAGLMFECDNGGGVEEPTEIYRRVE